MVGERKIPDNITIIENEEYNIPDILGLNLYRLDNEKYAGAIINDDKSSQVSTEIKLFNIFPVKNTTITNSKRICQKI